MFGNTAKKKRSDLHAKRGKRPLKKTVTQTNTENKGTHIMKTSSRNNIAALLILIEATLLCIWLLFGLDSPLVAYAIERWVLVVIYGIAIAGYYVTGIKMQKPEKIPAYLRAFGWAWWAASIALLCVFRGYVGLPPLLLSIAADWVAGRNIMEKHGK